MNANTTQTNRILKALDLAMSKAKVQDAPSAEALLDALASIDDSLFRIAVALERAFPDPDETLS